MDVWHAELEGWLGYVISQLISETKLYSSNYVRVGNYRQSIIDLLTIDWIIDIKSRVGS